MSKPTNPLPLNLTLTIPEAAKQLRQWAELTSTQSKNWDNYQSICEDMLNTVLTYGKQKAYEKMQEGKKNV